jgi:methylase of polypeptide subunit release factors
MTGAWLTVQRAVLGRRVGRLVMEQIGDMSVVVLPDVFNPAIFRTSKMLIDSIAAHVGRDRRVLDLGTGTGVAAIRAALAGGQVTAVDLNPEAIRCARINVLLNRVDDRVEVRLGDLFAPVAGERFHLVLCNPPFFRGVPRNPRDVAWRSDDFLERFPAGLNDALTPDGSALIVFSSHGDEPALLAALDRAGFASTRELSRDFGGEVITVYRATQRGATLDAADTAAVSANRVRRP